MDKELKNNPPIILFDGVCNLCNGFVQFVLKHEKESIIKFASLQSDYGQQMATKYHFDAAKMDSVLFISNDTVKIKSKAILDIIRFLKFPFNTFVIFKVIPSLISDKIYDYIANNRYRFFGKKESCWIPTPELKSRFIG